MSAISIENLTKRFGSQLAVDDLGFEVTEGTVVGFLGPNGAGKTTTLRILLGLVSANSGSAKIKGSSYRGLPDPAGTVGAVLEHTGFHPGRSGSNHLKGLAYAAGIKLDKVEAVLERVGLLEAAAKRVGAYSLGMKQRLCLAAALLGDPDILVLDEPANGLDPQGVKWFRDFLRSWASEGGTVLVSSHVLAEVAQTADEVVVISKGRLITQSQVSKLTEGSRSTVRISSPQANTFIELLQSKGVAVKPSAASELIAYGVTKEEIGELAAENSITVHELVAEHATLEDVFLELTESEGAAIK